MQLHQEKGETHCANIRMEDNRIATGARVECSERRWVDRGKKCLVSLPLSVAAYYLVRSIEAALDRKSVEKYSTNARCDYHV
jgi:hypothetical protein